MGSRAVSARIGALIRAKRRELGDIGLRDAADAADLSPSTLSRLERGVGESLPDTETLTKLAKWIGMSVEDLLREPGRPRGRVKAPELTVPETVRVHLRADKNLAPATAESLAEMFKLLYGELTRKHKGQARP